MRSSEDCPLIGSGSFLTAKTRSSATTPRYPSMLLSNSLVVQPMYPSFSPLNNSGVTVVDYILAGASAIGAGREYLPKDVLRLHQENRSHELARRF